MDHTQVKFCNALWLSEEISIVGFLSHYRDGVIAGLIRTAREQWAIFTTGFFLHNVGFKKRESFKGKISGSNQGPELTWNLGIE